MLIGSYFRDLRFIDLTHSVRMVALIATKITVMADEDVAKFRLW